MANNKMAKVENSDLSEAKVQIRLIIVVMKFLGIHPKQPKPFLFFSWLHAVICTTFVLLALQLMAINAADINIFMKGVETLLVYLSSLTKFMPIMLNMNKVNYLFDNLHKFWKSDNKAYYNFWSKLMMTYNGFVYISAVVLLIIQRGLTFAVYIPDYTNSYEIICITQKIQLIYTVPFITIIDSLYFGLCFLIIEQFTMLKKEFESCTDTERLKALIEHHAFLLEYTKCLAKTYSEALLLQYIIGVGGICSELYVIDGRDDIGDKIFAALLVGGLSMQLFIFCMSAAEISEKASDISNAAYFSKWYDLPAKDRRMFEFVITRAQSEVAFKAGTIIRINRPALTIIFKNAYSIYTLAKQLAEE